MLITETFSDLQTLGRVQGLIARLRSKNNQQTH